MKAIDMDLRTWFATFAPIPSGGDVHHVARTRHPDMKKGDRLPHEEYLDIVCELRFEYADAMVKAGSMPIAEREK